MAEKKYSFMDLFNEKSKAAAGANGAYSEIYLDPREVKPAEENTHQTLEGIEELADNFLTIGQEQPTVLARVNGEYRIVEGHRRNAANILNLERGYKEYEKVLFRCADMSPAMYELRLLAGNAFTQELKPQEKVRTMERMKNALIKARDEEGLEIKGRMRDVLAGIMGESKTNVARMESISNHLSEGLRQEFDNGNLGISAAYEASRMTEEKQREIIESTEPGETRAEEIARQLAEAKERKKTEKEKAGNGEDAPGQQEGYETPHPEGITSLCYSCTKYETCNVKTGTCTRCDQYKNRAEAYKTEEQRYSEEQDRIDRETKKKLREMEEERKLEKLPSQTRRTHRMEVGGTVYKNVCDMIQTFLLKESKGEKEGEDIELVEYKEGKETGRRAKARIMYIMQERTGLEDGYCILGIRILQSLE